MPNGDMPAEVAETTDKKLTKAQKNIEFNKIRNIDITYGDLK